MINSVFFDTISVSLIFFVLLAFFMYLAGKPKKTDTPGKTSIYACGENLNPENLNMVQKSFYNTIIDALRVNKLSKLHSGNLTEYLFLIAAGTFAIIILLVLLW
ncbi:MAG: hypothetical protein KAI53_05205 [Candidatus Aenigmarchaeota archaeon]|nr:hypothetical protein [Candidatus Aenigmarchaeota archaeon]